MAGTGKSSGRKSSGFARIGLLSELLLDAQLAWRLLRDEQVPMLLKGVPLLGLFYAISPVGLIPNAIPVIGEMDDIAVAALAIKKFIEWAPKDRVAYHRAILQGEQPSEEDRTIEGRARR